MTDAAPGTAGPSAEATPTPPAAAPPPTGSPLPPATNTPAAPPGSGSPQARPRGVLGTLLRAQVRMLANTVAEAAANTPVRLATLAVCILLVWVGIYSLFLRTFQLLNLQETYGGHAIHFLLLLFFMALTVMLFFSNGIILYAGLTRSREMDFLMASPAPTASIFLFKYVESFLYASWAMILLALPLIAAFTAAGGLPAWFVGVFAVFLLAFLPVPAAAGAMAALLVARFAPRRPRMVLAAIAGVLAAGLALWLYRIYAVGPGTMTDPWAALDAVFDQLRLVDHPLLPGYWLTQGLESAGNIRFGDADLITQPALREAGFYLAVTAVNALFLNTWAVNMGTAWMSRAVAAGLVKGVKTRTAGRKLDRFVGIVFGFLPPEWRVLIAKDLRLFFRDAAQWSQCLVFLMLLLMYMVNVPRLSEYLQGSRGQALLAGLNTLACGLIVAVFTSRFVFPMLSLEGPRIRLIASAPVGRAEIVLGKFCCSVLLCGAVAVTLSLLGALRLQVSAAAAAYQAVMTVCICLGLSAIAVGSGATWPDFKEDNAAKIAGGFGGTINLLISIGFLVGLVLPPSLAVGQLLSGGTDPWGEADPVRAGVLLFSAAIYILFFTAASVVLPLKVGIATFRKYEP